MTRAEFMRELERLLADIPESERIEALQYYNDYFDDAGAENELRVLVELGSPYDVAKSIKESLNSGEKPEKETACHTEAQNTANTPNTPNTPYTTRTAYASKKKEDKKRIPEWAWIFIGIGLVFAAPFIFAIAITVISILFAAFCVLVSLVLGFGGAAIGLLVAGVALLIAGLADILLPGVGIILLGAALICFAIGTLMVMILVVLVDVVIPACAKLVSKAYKKIIGKREKR